MKIERINDNQIRCTLSNFDLSVRNLNLTELAYGTEKTRNLFREMIQRAANEVGFDAEDIPLMIEAIPMANESVMLIITKLDDPEELDTRFSKFTPSTDDAAPAWAALATELLEGALANQTELPSSAANTPSFTDAPAKQTPQTRIYQFDTLDLVCAAAKETGHIFSGCSILYKNPSNKKFYLVLKKEDSDELAFSRTCNLLSEYGYRLKQDAAAEAYYEEHYECFVRQNALQSLAKV